MWCIMSGSMSHLQPTAYAIIATCSPAGPGALLSSTVMLSSLKFTSTYPGALTCPTPQNTRASSDKLRRARQP